MSFLGVLTAFTGPAGSIKSSLQLAFVYTIFNSIGVLIWLPIPILRWPIKLAQMLGKIVLKYPWFVKFYVITLYFVIPLIIFGLALVPYWIGIAVVGIPLVLLFIFFFTVRILQNNAPKLLKPFLRDFKWLPEWLRSLKPLDRRIKKISKCCRLKNKRQLELNKNVEEDINLGEAYKITAPVVLRKVIQLDNELNEQSSRF